MLKYRIIDFFRKTSVISEYHRIIQELSYDIEEINILRKNRLINLLIYLKKNIQFYNDFFHIYSIKEIINEPYTVLKSLPIIDKQIITQNYGLFISKKKIPFEVSYTGGSTSEPFRFLIDKRSLSRLKAYQLYFWRENCKYEFRDKVIVVGGSSLKSKNSVKGSIYDFLQNKYHLNTSSLNSANLKENIKVLLNSDYQFIYAYPSTIELHIDYAKKNNYLFNRKIKGIITTSETLFPSVREKIEKFFNVKVFDAYGARDGGLVSVECGEQNGFHYNFQDCIVEEVVSDFVKNEKELILTNLHSFKMPFVRYRVGDIGHSSSSLCNCNSKLPRIIGLRGRNRDVLKLKDGSYYFGADLNKIFFKYDGVIKYQAVQENDYNIRIIVQTAYEMNNKIKKNIIKEINKALKDESIMIEYNGKFIYGINSKFKTVISHVK